MTLGEKIKKLRIQNNLTQKELAEKAGLSEITIRKYESSERNPKFNTVEKIGSAFSVSGAWLMGYDVPMDSKVTADEAWDIESKKFEDKINAFYYQLSGLGWTCEWNDDSNMYLLSNGTVSFKITNDQYSDFVEDSQNFCKERLSKLYENSKLLLFPNDKSYIEPVAAHERTDIEVTDEMRKHDDDLMDDDDFWNK